jgi:hypothetical protein
MEQVLIEQLPGTTGKHEEPGWQQSEKETCKPPAPGAASSASSPGKLTSLKQTMR